MTCLKVFFFCVTSILCITSCQACGVNEIEVSCPPTCEADFCPKKEGQSACPQPESCPPPACKCQFDYRRAENGTCIPTKKCPPFECSRPNEVYTPCPPLCPDDCAHATPDGECPPTFGFIGIAVPCTPECRCKPHYWRKNGTCVFVSKC